MLLVFFAFSCGTSPESSRLKSEDDARRIHAGLESLLRENFRDDEGTVWSSSEAQLADDWIIQSPDGMWGSALSDVPTDVDCSTWRPGCDSKFRRMSCETDSDCDMAGSRCAPLEATVSRLGQKPKKLCLAKTDKLLDRLYRTMTSAKSELDVVSLALPTGQFRETLTNALAIVSQQAQRPRVRILLSGGPKPVIPNFISSAQSAADSLMAETIAKAPEARNIQMNVGFLFKAPMSWNHAKIIVADGERAITGGHNLWDHVYLTATPLFDLSMEYRGQAAADSRAFANHLWRQPLSGEGYYPKNLGRLPSFIAQPTTTGGVPVLAVGRMGSLGSNPSEIAMIRMVELAEHSLLVSQQDLYNHVVTPLTKSYIEDAMIEAAARGVKIDIVQSNDYPLVGGFGSVDGDRVYPVLIKRVSERLRERFGYAKSRANEIACQRIRYAPFRFTQNMTEWDASWLKRTLGTHSKFLMVDEASFYIGSHNIYPAHLQEFGLIVSDAAAAQKLKREYWDQIWGQSSTYAWDCPKI